MINRYSASGAGTRRKRVWFLAVLLLLALALLAGFYLGQSAVYSGMGIEPAAHREMQQALPAAREALKAKQGELDVQHTRHEVDRQALEMVRSELAAQRERIAALEEELGFYKSLMAPGEIANGLSLRPIELVAREEPGRFGFRIVAQQEARKHDLLAGQLYAEVFGLQGEEPISYPLAELSQDLDENVVALRFRYFQAIEGEMVLPDGFEPQGVSVVASSSSPRKAEVREQFSWQLQERFTHVGK
jgi:hypothetical protein